MDESGRKDAEGNSPVEQQGIFSSPDLAVNSENLEEIKPELRADNKSRIASAFAMTGATQRHDQLSEQMEAQGAISGTVIPANNATTSTATGDIKIPGAKKKSKLPLTLLVSVIFIAVGGCVAWTVLRLTAPETSKVSTLRKSFNEFANFFLYNTESDADLEGLYQYRELYYVGTLSSESEIDKHFLTAEDKFGVFGSEYERYLEQNIDNNFREYLDQLVESYPTKLDLLRCILQKPNLDADTILAAYIGDSSGVASAIAQYYSLYVGSSVESTRRFAVDYIAQTNSLLSAYQIYQDNGCIDFEFSMINGTCLDNIGSNEAVAGANEAYRAFEQYYNDVVFMSSQLIVDVYQNIWAISQEIE